MSPDDLQGILSAAVKGLSSFILQSALFSSAKPQQATQPSPSIPDNFEHIDLDSSSSEGTVM